MLKKKLKLEIYALQKHISMSAHKARRVIDQIRGCSYEDTLLILQLMPYRACDPILKLVSSAAANASYRIGSNKTDLIISTAEVNEGPTAKKFKPRSRGRSHPIKRPTCHITIGVQDLTFDTLTKLSKKQKKIEKTYQKNRCKNKSTDRIYHDMDSHGGVWDKK